MLSTHSHSRRIPTLIRLRPPSTLLSPKLQLLHPRLFTQSTHNNHHLLTSQSTPTTRPQLPFLYSPNPLSSSSSPGPANSSSSYRIITKITLNPHVHRLISTERRKKFTDGLKIAVKAYIAILLLFVIQRGIYQEEIERVYPTPSEWSLRSRWCLRSARALQDGRNKQNQQHKQHQSMTNWSDVGDYYRDLVSRLEDEECDGKGIKKLQADEAYDIEGMSEAWKKGYFEALMGSGETAEKLDGWVRDSKSKVAAPAEYVAGPSNPNPTVAPGHMEKVPRGEYSVTAFESPEVFYLKIMATKGFQTNQKLDAALAYADWLDFKGRKYQASKVYARAMDIATSGLSVDAEKVVDPKTGVLKDMGQNGGKYVTENLLRASTAMGVHQVRTGDLSSALSTFLYVLRARRNLSTAPQPAQSSEATSQYPIELKRMPSFLDNIGAFFNPPPYPLPVTTGNEPPTPSPCNEAGLMVYIGEIISASSSLEHGLSWTRDAVDTAQLALLEREPDADKSTPVSYSMQNVSTETRCGECLRAGMDNWAMMVRRLVVKAEKEELESMEKVNEGWFGMGEKRAREKRNKRRRWEAEEMILKDRRKRLERILGDDENPMLAI